MAVIRNTASMMLKGKVGATTYYVAETRQLARQAMNNSNYGESASRTDAQQNRRVRWANLVNFYSANKSWMKKAYEELKPGVSIFNRFMQLNINGATIPLTREQAQQKIWVAASYRVSQGSLPALPAQLFDNTKISFGDIANYEGLTPPIGNTLNVGNLSAGLINGSFGFAEGDALVIVQFFGTTAGPSSANLIPASYRYTEIVLNSSSTEALPTSGGTIAFESGVLTFTPAEGIAGIAFIHTRKSAGKLLVSTQNIFLKATVSADWTASAQLSAAIKSYGESETVPLNPGGTMTEIGGGGGSSSGGGGGGGDDGDLGG